MLLLTIQGSLQFSLSHFAKIKFHCLTSDHPSSSPSFNILHSYLHQLILTLIQSLIWVLSSMGISFLWNIAALVTQSNCSSLLFCSTVLHVSRSCVSRSHELLKKTEHHPPSPFWEQLRHWTKYLMKPVYRRVDTSKLNELANCLRWPHFLHPRSLLPTLCSKTLANSDLFPETVAFQLTSKHQRKDFTTPPHPFRLQSYSRAPCLNKRCSIFLGNDETTSHKRKVKIPQEQKGFLENKQNSFPARAKWKDLISRLFILGKGACCAGNGRD